MTYFLGRDVDVYITLEDNGTAKAVGLQASKVPTTFPEAALITAGATGPTSDVFANTMNSDANVLNSRVHDLTGVDLSISTSDEDVGPFLGQAATQSVELRKEQTITLTRKKSNECWDAIYAGPSYIGTYQDTVNHSFTGTNGTALITGASADWEAELWRVGMRVGGNSRIPRGAQIIAINAGTRVITLDKNISATGLTAATLYGIDNPTYLRQGARFGIAYGTPEYGDDDDALATFTGSPSSADGSRTQGTYNDKAPTSTSGDGAGLKFNIVVAANGAATFTLVSGGAGVAVGDTFTFADSLMGSGGGAAITLTAATITAGETARSVRQVSAGRTPIKETYSGSTYGNSNEEIYYGYRVHVRMKDAQEVYTIRNAVISAHTVSLNADGVTEETLELKSGVMPVMYTGATGTFYSTLTTAGEV